MSNVSVIHRSRRFTNPVEISYRLPVIPLLVLFVFVWRFPEPPRWLGKVGQGDEARFILERLRGIERKENVLAEAEFQDIRSVSQLKKAGNRTSY
jgi:hypothetical protein